MMLTIVASLLLALLALELTVTGYQTTLMEPWKTDQRFRGKVTFPHVRITLFDEPGCRGNANPKQYLNCFDSCWPVTDAPKSALLEAKHKDEFYQIALDGNSDPFEKKGPWGYGFVSGDTLGEYIKTYKHVSTRGPELQLFGDEGGGEGCAQRDSLARAVIPSGYNATCFDLEEQWSNKVTSMSLRHLEICPFDAEQTRRTFWYLLPEHIREDKHNWADMEPEDYPDWAKEDWHPIIAAWQYQAPKFYHEIPNQLFSTEINIDDVPKYLADFASTKQEDGMIGAAEVERMLGERKDSNIQPK